MKFISDAFYLIKQTLLIPSPFGPELVVNHDFSSGDFTGWTVVNEDPPNKTLTVEATGARYIIDTTSPQLALQQSPCTAGKTYRAVVKLNTTQGVLKVDGAVGASVVLANGVNTFEFTATGSLISITRSNAPVNILIDSVSIKETL